MVYLLVFLIVFLFSWWSIKLFDILKMQKEHGFWLGGVFKIIWDSEKLTEFAKILVSSILICWMIIVFTCSLLILKPLFIKKETK